MELFVIDDGWFGQRDDDFRSLGDWFPNRRKLPQGLKPTLEKIRSLGLKVGLWVEPEMVNEDSQLYRTHPDWALTVPGRKPTMSRSQLVLNMSRKDVVNWLYETLSALLRENPIDYLDANKHFHEETAHAIENGIDFYVPQTLLAQDGRRIMIGWMQAWEGAKQKLPGMDFMGMMTVPRELTIREDRICQWPVRELEAYRTNPVSYQKVTIEKETALPGICGRVMDLTLEIAPGPAGYESFTMEINKGDGFQTAITLLPQKGTICMDRSLSGFPHDVNHIRQFPVTFREGRLRLRLLLDRYSAELFVEDGQQAASMVLYPPENADGITFRADAPVELSVEKYDLQIPDNWRAAK